MLAIRKYFGLMRQIGASGINQVQARQPVFTCDLLSTQMLLYGEWIISAALNGGVICHNHAFASGHASNAGDDPGGVNLIFVNSESGQRREFQEMRTGIDEGHNTFVRK